MDKTAMLFVKQIIFDDVEDVMDALYNVVRAIKPDSVTKNQLEVDRIFDQAMMQTKKPAGFSREELPNNLKKIYKIRPPKYQYHELTSERAKEIFEMLKGGISQKTARDAALFAGQIAGVYALSCPVERFDEWANFLEGIIDRAPSFDKLDQHITLSITVYLSKSIYY